MSNLASIQRIIDIIPIEGAENIELVKVLGWQVVAKKGEFKINELCCYIQIDTVVPQNEYFEFLRSRDFRIRTIKLRKQLSQGLVVSLDSLPEFQFKFAPSIGYFWDEGEDVTHLIGVSKYEKLDNNPVGRYEKPRPPKIWYKKWVYLFKYNVLYKFFPSLQKKLRSNFPTALVSITDEDRIQNIPKVLENYKGKKFIASYKLDGSSITIIHNKVLGRSKYRICSRRFELHDKNNDWYKVFNNTNFKTHIDNLVAYFKTNDIIVQGEAIGKFNGNHHNLKQDEIRLFNIYVDGKRLLPNNFFIVCYVLDIPHCPLYKTLDLTHTMEEILKESEIMDVLNPKVNAEGLVWRCVEDGLSFKCINNQYLLKNEQ